MLAPDIAAQRLGLQWPENPTIFQSFVVEALAGYAELHRVAYKAISDASYVVFEYLPGVIAQIIEHKSWRSENFESFTDYALKGLGVNSNYKLWVLRCSMDINGKTDDGEPMPGKHVREWAEILARVDGMVRVEAAKEGRTIRSFHGNSLETLAKDVRTSTHGKITYLPSQQSGTFAQDGHLVRLHKNNPETFDRVARRELTVQQARKEAGLSVGGHANTTRAESAFRNMEGEDRAKFLSWVSKQLTPEEKQSLRDLLA